MMMNTGAKVKRGRKAKAIPGFTADHYDKIGKRQVYLCNACNFPVTSRQMKNHECVFNNQQMIAPIRTNKNINDDSDNNDDDDDEDEYSDGEVFVEKMNKLTVNQDQTIPNKKKRIHYKIEITILDSSEEDEEDFGRPVKRHSPVKQPQENLQFFMEGNQDSELEEVSQHDNEPLLNVVNNLFEQVDQNYNMAAEEVEAAVVENYDDFQTICVTGEFDVEHKVLKQMIKDKGLTYSQASTKNCDCLISADPIDEKSQKVRHARQYGVPIKDIAFLAKVLGVDEI